MSNGSLTIVGLGPGSAGYLSLETKHALENAEKVILRTAMHHTVAELEKQGFVEHGHLTAKAGDGSSLLF